MMWFLIGATLGAWSTMCRSWLRLLPLGVVARGVGVILSPACLGLMTLWGVGMQHEDPFRAMGFALRMFTTDIAEVWAIAKSTQSAVWHLILFSWVLTVLEALPVPGLAGGVITIHLLRRAGVSIPAEREKELALLGGAVTMAVVIVLLVSVTVR